MTANRPIEVAVIGGGCAGVAAAFELTRPEHQGKYHVTLYQQGWRLGGKGASARRPDGRIEEHGLHLWMGYYDNAFRLLRECYEELRAGNRPDFWDWCDAFTPITNIGAQEEDGAAWRSWLACFARNDLIPGDPPESWRPVSPFDYLLHGLELVVTLLGSAKDGAKPADSPDASKSGGDSLSRLLRTLESVVSTGMPFADVVSLSLLRAALAVPADGLGRLGLAGLASPFLDVLSGLQRELDTSLKSMAAGDTARRRVIATVEIVMANLRGMLKFDLLTHPDGFDGVDDYDYRDWLKLCGASDEALNSPVVRALYDLAFAYEDGDVKRPRLSAGQGLRSAMRAFFTYRGALFWKMNAGMGDVVFAPFYEVLSARGVTFRFFHRLERVEVDAADDSPHVSALHFDVQAATVEDCYRPLIEVAALPGWPPSPDYSQITGGDEGWDFESYWDTRHVARKTLRVTDDFDFVVLAVGLGAVPQVCAELIETNARWCDMVAHVKTIPTRSLQLWLKPDLAGLGWRAGSYDVSGFAEPFDTWADMTHLARAEAGPVMPGNISYFCSVLPDGAPPPRSERDYPSRRSDEVRRDAVRFLNENVRHIWPTAVDEKGAFRWDLLAYASDCGEDAIRSQHWTANVNPTDRYTLALPGSNRYRISPLDSGYDNLTIAGDWTDCGLNVGCVEAAFMSGRLAAHALSASPPLEEIVGFDHP
jgi:uncharacterized protein with NAD-binding domain and iron-sulfur cluster